MSEDQKQKKRICPCCGMQSLSEVPQVSQDVLDQYIACIMTGEPFIKTYLAYDGKISIQVSNMTDTLSTKAMKASDYIDKASLELHVKETAKYITYRLLVIPSITVTTGTQSKRFDIQNNVSLAIQQMLSKQDINKAVQEYIQNITSASTCSGLPAKLLDKVTKHHTDLLNALVQRGFDQSFCNSIQFN